jgi:anti-sigma factor RsiW
MHDHGHCGEYVKYISDYIDGELPPEICARLEAHLLDCINCRIVVDTMRKTIELYQVSSVEDILPDTVHDRLFARLNLDSHDDNA